MFCLILKVSSVHIDGSVILRSSTDRQAICKLCLPPSVNPKQCSYTADGKRLLTITGEARMNYFDDAPYSMLTYTQGLA